MNFVNKLSGSLQGIVACELPDFDHSKIYTDLMVEDHYDSLAPLKRLISRNINKVVDDCKHFKIGKSGAPKDRFAKYQGYKKMLLLCRSADAYVVDVLEAYYNEKYFDYPNNDNKKMGSACAMTDRGSYFLYMVIS